METRLIGSRNVFGILLLFGSFLLQTETILDPENFQRKLIALNKVLDYIYNKAQRMNVDVIFGVTLTEANLAAALLHDNVRHLEDRFFNALEDIVALCDLTRKRLMNVVSNNENEFLLQSVLNNPDLWTKPVLWTRIFSKVRFNSSRPLSHLEIVESIWHGTPNETESDRCLMRIVHSNLNGRCQIPDICIQILTRDDNPMGYPLTHRLLIVQIAKALGCRENKLTPFSYLVSEYCAKILQHLVDLEAWNFPSMAADLATEQIILCGMEGYYEFVDKHYENLILSWPHQSGCFSAFRFSEERQITRRSSSVIDFGCDSHATALGAASLAIFIRKSVENPFGLPPT
ncbi:PREDICTED: UPF0764 protein C16orf89 homolog [Dinoponera quadriceps]|uniref:UPF0764 protein C16orf89 homolog n=1 Tax=Dinoponera quadriceps TaxID=609295 RepID=A0A6P3XW22_DINQU|nr:PREDICTED: UPF0764 protein C16orf89 homolog [Dinoponera quadriceps]